MTDENGNNKRSRGRPRGQSAKGRDTENRLFEVAIGLFDNEGYESTTLRAIAEHAQVSVGLLYRYFPSKRAIVLALYSRLTDTFVAQAEALPPGSWRDRVAAACRLSLSVLGPHRGILRALIPTLVSTEGEGVLSSGTTFSRTRVVDVFVSAVVGADDAPRDELGQALGRLSYTGHLMVILWWLLDRSPGQRATDTLLARLEGVLGLAALSLNLPGASGILSSLDALVRDALHGPLDLGGELEGSTQ